VSDGLRKGTKPAGQRTSAMIRAFATTALTTTLVLAWAAFAQTAPAPAFDVASVKALDLASEARTSVDFRIQPGGRLEMINATLRNILQEAFAVKRYQLSGGPGWANTDHFTIIAKAEGDPSRQQMMAMLQTLLAERFQLKVHREVKDGNVYAMVVAKGGLKLQPSTADQSRFSTYRNDPPGVSYTLVFRKVSMARIAEGIGDFMGTPVLDRTGIQGEFDFKMGPFAGDDNPDSGPSIFSVIQEQLGLKLETAKGPIEMLVIDHVEKPSAN
jgi:uncharacterized protein (TIGR03435 family)